jgi:glucose/arabinose dehydrogenase
LRLAACGRDGEHAGRGGDSAARVGAAAAGTVDDSVAAAAAARVHCAPNNAGITLPAGFCAALFADSVGGARHITVAPNGDVFVALMTAPTHSEAGASAPSTGGVLALRDSNGDGMADERKTFGDLGGTGIWLHGDHLYADAKTAIVRFPLPAGSLTPSGKQDTIVRGLPTKGHEARNIALDKEGNLYVNVGSKTNACQQKDRVKESPGIDPCTELETRAGIWRYASDKTGQTFSTDQRFATGIRNGEGLTVSTLDGAIYATQHGRDQLSGNWPAKFTNQQSAELPAEEFMRVEQGDDFGWPYCYYDQKQRKRVLAPEYGGDGKEVGRCADKKPPLATFPGHWAPMSAVFYTASQFPARYRGGVFIAFHGSWNRAPLPQEGYRVVFVPFADGKLTGDYETFADGFAAGKLQPDAAEHRPVGLAQAPDGSLYITDDQKGRIWKVVYTGAGASRPSTP